MGFLRSLTQDCRYLKYYKLRKRNNILSKFPTFSISFLLALQGGATSHGSLLVMFPKYLLNEPSDQCNLFLTQLTLSSNFAYIKIVASI